MEMKNIYLIHGKQDLIIHRTKKREEATNLLFSDELDVKEKNQTKEKENRQTYPHIRNEIYFTLIHDTNVYDVNGLPPQFNMIDFTIDRHNQLYQPILDTRSFWNRQFELYEKEDNKTSYNTTVKFEMYWNWKYFLEIQYE